MIIDELTNYSLYLGVHPRLAAAFDYLRQTDLSQVEPGTREIDGRKVYVMVQQYETKVKEKGRWEAHRKYIDVQYVLQGMELFGYASLKDLKAIQYDEAKDFLSLQSDGPAGDFFRVREGTFVILFPQDAHMPGIALSRPSPVKKVVVKVAIAD
jgi:YhcH/YjgK/YiaL family protein